MKNVLAIIIGFVIASFAFNAKADSSVYPGSKVGFTVLVLVSLEQYCLSPIFSRLPRETSINNHSGKRKWLAG